MSRKFGIFELPSDEEVEILRKKIPKDDKEFYRWIRTHESLGAVLGIKEDTYRYYASDVYIKLQKVVLCDSRLEAGYWLLKDIFGLKNEEITREMLLKATVVADVIYLLFHHITKPLIPVKFPIPVPAVIEKLQREIDENSIMFL